MVSLCEFRGFRTPRQALADTGAAVVPVLSWPPRRPAGFSGGAAGGRRGLMGLLRSLSWWLLLAPALARAQRPAADLVVTPNDSAFPYNRIMAGYRRRRIPALLMQEGIRFPLPAQPGPDRYGTGGAAAIAAWGETSVEYFAAAGAPADRIHATGSPRFERLADLASPAARAVARRRYGLPARTLLLVSNPIDDQGFCSTRQKMELIERFLEGLEPLFADPEFHLAIKLHGREDPGEFRRLIASRRRERTSLFTGEPLWELLAASSAAVVIASTVGLEALAAGLPLAVLEIPGHGFQYDYVESGAASGLSWDAPMAPRVEALFAPSEQRQRQVEAYVRRQLGSNDQATARVVALIDRLLDEPS